MRSFNLITAIIALFAYPLTALPNPSPDSSNGQSCSIPFSDTAVAPAPAAHYERYITFLAIGVRTYSCTSGNFTLTNLNYDLYDATCKKEGLIGRRVHMADPDPSGGIFAQYTKVGAFTYFVSKATASAPDPAAKDASYLPLQQELVTERSEPKWDYAEGFDLGQANFLTRFGATGNPMSSTLCETITLNSTAYYSFWKRIS